MVAGNTVGSSEIDTRTSDMIAAHLHKENCCVTTIADLPLTPLVHDRMVETSET